MANVKSIEVRTPRTLQTLPKIPQPAHSPHTPFVRIATHAKYAQLTMWTARVLSQCMVLEHMKEDDESRV